MRYSISEIRDLLHIYHIPSPQGKEFWSHATILYILSNERYAGNVTMQKTFVQDLFSHKSVKNRGQLPKYEIIDYHPKLVSETDWIEVQRLSFNQAAIIELNYPTHVCLCSTYDGQQIVLKAFSEAELRTVQELSLPFYERDSSRPQKRISLGNKALADSVRMTMGWEGLPAMKVKGVFYSSHRLLLFDLCQAVPVTQKTPVAKIVPLTEYPTFEDVARSLPPQLVALPASNCG